MATIEHYRVLPDIRTSAADPGEGRKAGTAGRRSWGLLGI